MTILLAILKGGWDFLRSLPPWVYAVIALVGLHFWLVHEARVQERDACVIERQKDKEAWAAELATKLKAAEDKAKAKDEAHATELAAIQKKFQKELSDANAQRDKDVAAAHAGSLILRFLPDRGSSVNLVPSGTASAPGSVDPAPSELPRSITADLYALADDADATAKQLAACQSVVLSDRATN